jgi:hypothetical protein
LYANAVDRANMNLGLAVAQSEVARQPARDFTGGTPVHLNGPLSRLGLRLPNIL